MPQATNLAVAKEKEFSPVGPGTVFNHVLKISNATRERANLINKTEEARLQRMQRLLDKEKRFSNNVRNKVMQRASKTLTEKRALLKLLENDYKVKNFITMKQDFNPSQIEDVETARRYVIETRVFNSGFNVKSMRPEVRRQIRMLDPNHKYKTFKKKLLDDTWSKNVEIDRTINDQTFDKMLHDRKHWRDYNYPPNHPKWLATKDPLESIKSQSTSRRQSKVDEIEVVTMENAAFGQPGPENEDATKEKSIVLERRLLRRPDNACNMTLRTLGPVYFQTTTAAVPETLRSETASIL
ncbi:uncharacterized protein LOC128245396 [Mya arenaria]|nr:uncharacterized protein LOC128245396 [Mya arenaria]